MAYRGPFNIGKHDSGHAVYNYYIDRHKNTLKHGNFSYKTDSFIGQQRLIQKSQSGRYSHGLKDQYWSYTNGDYTISIQTVTDNLNVTTSLNGTRSVINAYYKKGIPEGKWSYEKNQVTNPKLLKKISEGEISFKEGKLSGPFSFYHYDSLNHYKISGQLDHQGCFDGKWFLTYQEAGSKYQEERIYKNGFLISLQIHGGNTEVPLYEIQYNGVESKLKQLLHNTKDAEINFTVGEKSFGVLFNDGFLPTSDEIKLQLKGNHLLEKSLGIFIDTSSAFLLLQSEAIIRNGFTKRFKYIYTTEEDQKITEVLSRVVSYDSLLSIYLDDNTFAANKQRSDSLAFCRKAIENGKNKLGILKSKLLLLQTEEFRYQSRINYFQKGIPGIVAIDSIEYNYNGKEQVKILDSKINFYDASNIVNNIFDYTNYYTKLYDTIFAFIDRSIVEIQLEKRDQILEEKIVDYSDSVLTLYRPSHDSTHNKLLVLMHKNIEQQLETKIQDYSISKNFEERQEQGNLIIEFCKAYIQAYSPMTTLLQKTEVMDEAFTRYAYNPYTGKHDIKTRIKKNTYHAASEYLIPYYFYDFGKTSNYTLIASWVEEAQKAYSRIIELSNDENKDSKIIDKKLKKESSPDRIKKIIGL